MDPDRSKKQNQTPPSKKQKKTKLGEEEMVVRDSSGIEPITESRSIGHSSGVVRTIRDGRAKCFRDGIDRTGVL